MHDMEKLQKLILLFPFLYLLHDLEEILTVEHFLVEHSLPIHITTWEFTVAFLLLWIIAIIGCYQASRARKFLWMKPVTFFSFLVPGILLANGVGHVLQSIFFHGYVPGLLTSIFIQLGVKPLSL